MLLLITGEKPSEHRAIYYLYPQLRNTFSLYRGYLSNTPSKSPLSILADTANKL